MFNIVQFIQMLRSGNFNPQAILMQMLQSQPNNPFMMSLLNMAQNKDQKGLEEVARNMMREKGLDFDKEFSNFKNTYHL